MRRKRHPWLFILAVVTFASLIGFTNFFAPATAQLVILFFGLFALGNFFLWQYLLNNVRRALLVTLGVTVFLGLRYLNLRQPFYLILLIASLISLEVYWQKR